jgi:hypothetical protein
VFSARSAQATAAQQKRNGVFCAFVPICYKQDKLVDRVSLIFIEFYVPPLTPRLNRTETSLQLSENITFFAVCRIYTGVIKKET